MPKTPFCVRSINFDFDFCKISCVSDIFLILSTVISPPLFDCLSFTLATTHQLHFHCWLRPNKFQRHSGVFPQKFNVRLATCRMRGKTRTNYVLDSVKFRSQKLTFAGVEPAGASAEGVAYYFLCTIWY